VVFFARVWQYHVKRISRNVGKTEQTAIAAQGAVLAFSAQQPKEARHVRGIHRCAQNQRERYSRFNLPGCFATVASVRNKAELAHHESIHRCDPTRFLLASQDPSFRRQMA
jgi:hypothetical protein